MYNKYIANNREFNDEISTIYKENLMLWKLFII